jgi:RHS repeat-associated protein
MIDTLGRHHGNTYTTPLSGAFTGPSLMAGSNDATPSTTTLTGSLRSGDYQIGRNAYPQFGGPAGVSLYRDATFQLAYTERFDAAFPPRLTQKADRTAFAFDSTATPPHPGPSFDRLQVWWPSTSMPLLSRRTDQATVTDARFDRDVWFDVNTQVGGFDGSPEPAERDTFTRDAGGRVTQVEHRFFSGGAAQAIKLSSYVYRPDGRLARITNPDGIHDFTYNGRGLVETQTVSGDGTYTYGYDELGRNAFLEYPDGHVRRQHFDDLGRITSRCYEYTGGADTRCYTATYDPVGNPLSMLDPEGEDVFEYDALDRLKKATRKDSLGVVIEVDEYDYNALGPLKKNANVILDDQRPRLDGAGLAPAAVPATSGGQPITLDAAGRVTSFRGTTFDWGKSEFPLSVQEPLPAPLEKYGIDAEQRRAVKLRGSLLEFYFYEGMDRVATLDGAGNVKEATLFDGIDHPLRIKHAGGVAYYELDLAGNVRRLRNSGGSDLGGYRYTAFGQTKEDTATLVQPLRWKARWHSTLNGAEIYDVRARQWAPEIGAFLSVDEFGFFQATTTLWGWPHQNPIAFRDPTGHDAEECGPSRPFKVPCEYNKEYPGATCMRRDCRGQCKDQCTDPSSCGYRAQTCDARTKRGCEASASLKQQFCTGTASECDLEFLKELERCICFNC